jgi:hypothetical protein
MCKHRSSAALLRRERGGRLKSRGSRSIEKISVASNLDTCDLPTRDAKFAREFDCSFTLARCLGPQSVINAQDGKRVECSISAFTNGGHQHEHCHGVAAAAYKKRKSRVQHAVYLSKRRCEFRRQRMARRAQQECVATMPTSTPSSGAHRAAPASRAADCRSSSTACTERLFGVS